MERNQPKHGWRDVTIRTDIKEKIKPMKKTKRAMFVETFCMIAVLFMATVIGLMIAGGL